MNTDKELMQQALMALEEGLTSNQWRELSAVLRDRLAQPEPEPKCGAIIEVFGKDWRLDYMSLPVGKHKLYTQQYTYIAPPAEQESVAHAVIAGVLFDFMGWLTSRKERIVLSSADNASPAVEAITEFAKIRSLSLDDARVTNWQDIARGSDAA
jgi:hypothetical protein